MGGIQGECELRFEVLVKMQKKKKLRGRGGLGPGRVRFEGVQMDKWGRVESGKEVRVGVEEVKFLWKLKKKFSGVRGLEVGWGGGGGGGSGWM